MALAGLGLLLLAWWWTGQDGRVRELNALLEADPQLAAYPYRFRVLALETGVATMSSPRSARVSAIQGLRILFPELQVESAISDRMMAAQRTLAATQTRAAGIVADQPDVNSVVWELDERWLSRHGVVVD